MGSRAAARLAAVSGVAIGVLACAFTLAHGSSAPSSGVGTAALAGVLPAAGSTMNGTTTAIATRTATSAAPDAQSSLQQGLASSSAARGSAGAYVPGAGATVVDETKPHTHLVDPRTGGLVSVAGARGVVKDVKALGPVHVDPVPAGVDLSDPIDTDSLIERAEISQAALAADGAPISAGATAPPGTPSVDSLSQHVAPSCSGTGTDGHRVQVLYVHETGTPSRLTSVLPVLRDEVANVDDVFAVSSEQTGGGRRVRWVHDADCLPVIKDVSVPGGALGTDIWATINAVKAAGYTDPNRKYLMFADAKQLCGIGTLYGDEKLANNLNDGYAASYARVDASCWSTSSSVAAHELTHTLGGVQPGAPHATANGHCWDESDIMCYVDGAGVQMKQICPGAQEDLLDCNHDDYFNTNPAAGSFLAKNWNTASSSFLDTVPPLDSGPAVAVAPAPTAQVSVPTSATVGAAFPVSVTATGQGPFGYAWAAGSCVVADPSAVSTTVTCPPGGAPQQLTVGVVVTQHDGQVVKASGVVPVAAVDGTRPPGPSTVWSAPVLSRGTLSAVLVDSASGARLSGVLVRVEVQSYGRSTFVTYDHVVTDASGVARTVASYAGAGTYRFVFDGDAQEPPSTSSQLFVRAPTRTVATRSPHKVVRAQVRRTSGVGVPWAPVTLQRHSAGRGHWSTVRTVRSNRYGVAAAKVRPTRLTYYRWVFHGEVVLQGSTSRQLALRG